MLEKPEVNKSMKYQFTNSAPRSCSHLGVAMGGIGGTSDKFVCLAEDIKERTAQESTATYFSSDSSFSVWTFFLINSCAFSNARQDRSFLLRGDSLRRIRFG